MHEYKALQTLVNNNDIIIKPTDKTLNRNYEQYDYVNKRNRQLNNAYFMGETNENLTGEVIHRFNLHVHIMEQRDKLLENACHYLTMTQTVCNVYTCCPK